MKNLESYGVQEMNAKELISIEGGRKRDIWKILGQVSDVIGLTEAYYEFRAGFNSVEC